MHGWEPVVLSLDEARCHPKFDALSQAIPHYPTINPSGFDSLCWLRWLALDEAGGGFFADYDCINRGWEPPEPAPTEACSYSYVSVEGEEAANVLVYTPSDWLEGLVETMLDRELVTSLVTRYWGNPQISDMILFNHLVRCGKLKAEPQVVTLLPNETGRVVHVTQIDNGPASKLIHASRLLPRPPTSIAIPS